jgi:hypothetical protein
MYKSNTNCTGMQACKDNVQMDVKIETKENNDLNK